MDSYSQTSYLLTYLAILSPFLPQLVPANHWLTHSSPMNHINNNINRQYSWSFWLSARHCNSFFINSMQYIPQNNNVKCIFLISILWGNKFRDVKYLISWKVAETKGRLGQLESATLPLSTPFLVASTFGPLLVWVRISRSKN